jgi:hypothetical protein
MKAVGTLIILMFFTSLLARGENNSDTVEYEIQGKIISRTGNVVKIKWQKGKVIPVKGNEGELAKYFETELFGGKVSGWMAIGKMKVSSVLNDIITFTLLKELSFVTENGVKKNHFEKGKEVKFTWKVPVSEDEAAYEKGQISIDKDIDEALKYYKKAIEVNPKHDKSLNMIGMIMSEKKLPDSALFYFLKAYEIDPKNVTYVKNLCVTNLKLNRKPEAYEYAKTAVALDTLDIMALYLRGFTYYKLKINDLTESDKQTIISDINTAIQLKPYNSFLYSERAFFKKEFGDKNGACEDAKKAIQLGEENADALTNAYCK